jgi:hypothetical protein
MSRHERTIATSDVRSRRIGADGVARAVRDRLLRATADRFCPAMSDRSAALYLRSQLLRYRAGAFRRDRFCEIYPGRLGTLTESLWAILMALDRVPSERAIRRTLSGDFTWPTS